MTPLSIILARQRAKDAMKVEGGNPSKARQPLRPPVFARIAEDGFDDLIDLLAIFSGHRANELSSFPRIRTWQFLRVSRKFGETVVKVMAVKHNPDISGARFTKTITVFNAA